MFALSNITFAESELRVMVGKSCPVAAKASLESALLGLALPIAESVLKKILASGVDQIIEKLKPDDVKQVSSHPVYIDGSQEDAKFNCLIVAMGEFSNSTPTNNKMLNPKGYELAFKNGAREDAVSNQIKQVFGEYFVKSDLYLEAQLEVSSDKTAYRWLPLYFEFTNPVNKHLFVSKQKSIRLDATFNSVSGGELLKAVITFPNVKPSYVFIPTEDNNFKFSAWIPTPNSSKSEEKYISEPYSLSVLYTESVEANLFSKAVRDALDENKENIITSVNETLIPSDRNKVKDKIIAQYWDSVSTLIGLVDAYHNSCDDLTGKNTQDKFQCLSNWKDLEKNYRSNKEAIKYISKEYGWEMPSLPAIPLSS